jgi:NTE family protein
LSDGEDTKRQREWCDFLIEPDLTSFHAGSFNSSDSLIKRGYDAAMESFDDLQKLAKRLDEEFGPKKAVQIPKIDSVLLTGFEVEGISKANRDLVIDRLSLTRNRWYKPDVFPESMKKVYGTRYFRKVSYELFKYDDGTRIRLKGNENPPSFFNVALNYNSFSKAALILNLTSRNLLGKNTRFSSTLNIADMLRFKSEYFKYLGTAKNHGLGISFWFDNYDFPFYETLARLAMYRQKYTALDVKYQIASLTVNTAGIGLRRELVVLTPNVYGSGENYDGSIVQDRVYLDFNLNTLNRHYYAHSGSKVGMSLSYFFNNAPDFKLIGRDSLNGGFTSKDMTNALEDSLITSRYLQFKLLSSRYIHINKKGTLVLGFYSGFTFNPFKPEANANTVFNNFMLGGLVPNFRNQIPFVGLSDFQIRTNNFIGAQFGYQYELSKNLFITPKINLGYHNNNFVRYFTSNDVLKSSNQLFGIGITGGFNSILGPLDFTIMRSTQLNSFVFYVNLGYNF